MTSVETEKEPASRHVARVRVRYQETDAMGVVYYANYLVYFEVGRVELLRAIGADYARLEQDGYVAAVTEARCRYYSPALFDDLLEIHTSLSRLGRTTFTFTYEIRRAEDARLLVTGQTEHALLSRATLRPSRMPGWAREATLRAMGLA
ncbi:MAG: acyl-CoA thioesterase [Chloroflexi bacterium]|nr:acyl-CoA thioesterase [Chloroflexota bacterium]